MRLYHFITPTLANMADIFSLSSRYGELFCREVPVTTAIAGVYKEILLLLQRVETLLHTNCELYATMVCRTALIGSN